MISFPNIDPVILKIGHLSVRWYGMMYIIGFASSYLLIRYQMKKKGFNSGKAFVDTLYSYIILGLLIGARLGYVFFTIVHITSGIHSKFLHSGMEVCPFMAV